MKMKHTVNIAGTRITLLSDENKEYVKGLADLIDRRVTDLVITHKNCTKLEALLLCSLDYLDERTKLALENENLKQKIAELEKKKTTK